jgi:hypothetical protein
MKNQRYLIILFVMIFSLNGCVSAPIKTATEYAENIDFDPVAPETIENFEELCYIFAKDGGHILSVDGIELPSEWMFIKPGAHLLTVQYSVRHISQHQYMDAQGRWRTQTTTYETKSGLIPRRPSAGIRLYEG